MRFSDLAKLSLSALWQQKLRTSLTTLGVIFSSFVLFASLSIRDGVNERIVQEHARIRELREIQVYQGRSSEENLPPKEELDFEGDVSSAKRERLRQEIIRRWQSNTPSKSDVRLTRERIEHLQAIPHVRAVRPQLSFSGRALLGAEAEYAVTISATSDNERLFERIVAGQQIDSNSNRQVLVSEYLLFKLGVVDDADVTAVIGKKLSIEYRGSGPNPIYLVSLLSGQGNEVNAKDEELLRKVVKQLPAALANLDLTPVEKAALARLLKPSLDDSGNEPSVVSGHFAIRGVLRSPSDTEFRNVRSWQEQNADIFLPVDAMADILFQIPELKERGFEHAVVEVDDLENVKLVKQQIDSTGLQTRAMIEFIEREQALYTMIFSAMTLVAVVGLLVAALGIINTMLMSVLERVREIGIMKAVGARNGHIQAIFVIEGALIGLFGGVAGTLLAWAASHPGDAWVQSMAESKLGYKLHGSVFAFPLWLTIGVPVFATLVTTIAAVFPARRAARVDPVTALRHE